ncbi:putative clathrin assembly protein At5g57200 [Gossypium raimondii]|uniref:putative clathrin assembly protein At5g57200 n=1 Tax=Gossypium raimondii TaxID=29730 RepID=UPI00227BEFCD|nr:putative clathrin assembly protein At5g57200 [Gossypium raimondii]
MGTLNTLRKAYGVLKDKTKIGLAKFNSNFQELDIAIIKATNHIESPPKERHVRKIFAATSVSRPQTDIAYCVQALAKRLSKTRSWIVAAKILIVIHRTLREGDPTFRDELLNYAHRGNFLQISNFKDDSSHFGMWDCHTAWVKTYAVFLEKRLDCFRVLQYDIEAERLTKLASGGSSRGQSRRMSSEELIEQLPALQQLLSRLIGCQPEGAASDIYLIQYALALVLKESFKIYCAINDGIMNLIDVVVFKMSQDDAVKALGIYKRAGQQVEELAEFYEYCKGLELAKNFQFPALRQPPPSFLATMEEYVKEAPQSGSVQNREKQWNGSCNCSVSFPINGSSELPDIGSHKLPKFGSLELPVYYSYELPNVWLARASHYMAHMSFPLYGSKELLDFMLVWAYLYMN